jgi:hypothetical protein
VLSGGVAIGPAAALSSKVGSFNPLIAGLSRSLPLLGSLARVRAGPEAGDARGRAPPALLSLLRALLQ